MTAPGRIPNASRSPTSLTRRVNRRPRPVEVQTEAEASNFVKRHAAQKLSL